MLIYDLDRIITLKCNFLLFWKLYLLVWLTYPYCNFWGWPQGAPRFARRLNLQTPKILHAKSHEMSFRYSTYQEASSSVGRFAIKFRTRSMCMYISISVCSGVPSSSLPSKSVLLTTYSSIYMMNGASDDKLSMIGLATNVRAYMLNGNYRQLYNRSGGEVGWTGCG